MEFSKPTVTELLDLLNKPALLRWANELGLKGVHLDAYRNESRAEGNALHQQIKNFLELGEEFDDKVMGVRFEKFLIGKKVLGTEVEIETPYFRGRYDIKFEDNGVLYLGDFKSSYRVYPETRLQLTAYRMAEPKARICVIHLPKFSKRDIEINFLQHEEVLGCLSNLYSLLKKI